VLLLAAEFMAASLVTIVPTKLLDDRSGALAGATALRETAATSQKFENGLNVRASLKGPI
jgi:hypothetical protein